MKETSRVLTGILLVFMLALAVPQPAALAEGADTSTDQESILLPIWDHLIELWSTLWGLDTEEPTDEGPNDPAAGEAPDPDLDPGTEQFPHGDPNG